MAERRGAARAKQAVFVSDGAGGIRSLRDRCFPEAAFILDWSHATSHLHDDAMARGAPPDGASEKAPRRILANNVQYFRGNAAGMDYATFRRNGWPIGSGIIESLVKQAGMRVKGTERHWNVPNVEQTLQAVACLISEDGTWDNFWRSGRFAA